MLSYVSSGSAAREMLREPTGVVCFDGRLFVADSRNHRVQARVFIPFDIQFKRPTKMNCNLE